VPRIESAYQTQTTLTPREAILAKQTAKPYNCKKCPGYCCSYPLIEVGKRDIKRIARHFGLTPAAAARRFTRLEGRKTRVMRRKKDKHFGRICQFFDTKERRCTIYEARPNTCRDFPAQNRCGYWDFLTFERKQQGDNDWVARTDSAHWR
jgi:uncharacterized protein